MSPILAREKPYFVGGQVADVKSGRANLAAGGFRGRRVADIAAYVSATGYNCPGAANTKGAWTAHSDPMLEDAHGFQIAILQLGRNRDYLLDYGVGAAGAEVPIINNLQISSCRFDNVYWTKMVPLFIPKGSRVSFRAQCSTASEYIELWSYWFFRPRCWPKLYRTCETFGAVTGDSGGTSVDPGGTAYTKGAWVELTSATSRRIRMLTWAIGNQLNSGRADADFYHDIGVGAAGSEVVHVADTVSLVSSSGDLIMPQTGGPRPVDIPAGSRIAARAMNGNTSSPSRLSDITVYGFAP